MPAPWRQAFPSAWNPTDAAGNGPAALVIQDVMLGPSGGGQTYINNVLDVATASDSVVSLRDALATVFDAATGVDAPTTRVDHISPVYDSASTVLFENLQPYSEDPTQAHWTKYNTTVSFDSTTPDGVAVHKLSEMATSGVTHYLGTASSYRLPLGSKPTTSVELKMGTRRYVAVSCALNVFVTFDLLNGAIAYTSNANITGSIQPHPRGNGWYICKVALTGTLTSPAYQPMAVIETMLDPTGWIFQGDVNEHVFIGRTHFYREAVAPNSAYVKTGATTIQAAGATAVVGVSNSVVDSCSSNDSASAVVSFVVSVSDGTLSVDGALVGGDSNIHDVATAVDFAVCVMGSVRNILDSTATTDTAQSVKSSVAQVQDSAAVADVASSVKDGASQASDIVVTSDLAVAVKGGVSSANSVVTSQDFAAAFVDLVVDALDSVQTSDGADWFIEHAYFIDDVASATDDSFTEADFSATVLDLSQSLDAAVVEYTSAGVRKQYDTKVLRPEAVLGGAVLTGVSQKPEGPASKRIILVVSGPSGVSGVVVAKKGPAPVTGNASKE